MLAGARLQSRSSKINRSQRDRSCDFFETTYHGSVLRKIGGGSLWNRWGRAIGFGPNISMKLVHDHRLTGVAPAVE